MSKTLQINLEIENIKYEIVIEQLKTSHPNTGKTVTAQFCTFRIKDKDKQDSQKKFYGDFLKEKTYFSVGQVTALLRFLRDIF